VKKGGGFISWFLKRKVWTVEDALREARSEESGGFGGSGWGVDEFEGVGFKDMGNGESMILE
jgi:hypothetical protein